jgi:ferric-dicitrate binding protein FerR (iron transport regulator)
MAVRQRQRRLRLDRESGEAMLVVHDATLRPLQVGAP